MPGTPSPMQETFILLLARSSQEEARALRLLARPARKLQPMQKHCPGTQAPLTGARMARTHGPSAGRENGPWRSNFITYCTLPGRPPEKPPGRGVGQSCGAQLVSVAVVAQAKCLPLAHFSLSTPSLVVRFPLHCPHRVISFLSGYRCSNPVLWGIKVGRSVTGGDSWGP